jgi:hypothetical protein
MTSIVLRPQEASALTDSALPTLFSHTATLYVKLSLLPILRSGRVRYDAFLVRHRSQTEPRMAAEHDREVGEQGNAYEAKRNHRRPASTEGAGRAVPEMRFTHGGNRSNHREWLCIHLVRMQCRRLHGTMACEATGDGGLNPRDRFPQSCSGWARPSGLYRV